MRWRRLQSCSAWVGQGISVSIRIWQSQ